jgi:hypothetical protein
LYNNHNITTTTTSIAATREQPHRSKTTTLKIIPTSFINHYHHAMSLNMIKEDMSFNDQASLYGEDLPAYTEATKGQAPFEVTEKEIRRQSQSQRSSSKMSTFKSILTGDVQKYNPKLALSKSIDEELKGSRSTPKSKSSSSSTLKSILTGDVQRHHPMYRLEESVDPSVRRR